MPLGEALPNYLIKQREGANALETDGASDGLRSQSVCLLIV